jgi:dihydroneopterin aldolase
MDKIIIRQLQIDALIGIHDWEKQNRQPVIIDFDLFFDCTDAAASDDIKDALDYFVICEEVTRFVKSSRFELIERLAEELAQLILAKFPCDEIKLTLLKPNAVANAQSVGIEISRSQQ